MSANSFGSRFVVTTFGESHGVRLGAIIDGCPALVPFELPLIQKELDRRKPGTSTTVSARKELDQVEVLSGVFEEKTLGTPIALLVRNSDARSADYDQIQKSPRAGHADDVWKLKFGFSDHRGGGRSSGRETVSRVMAGAVAQMFNRSQVPSLKVRAWASTIGNFQVKDSELEEFLASSKSADDFPQRFIGRDAGEVTEVLKKSQENGDSLGGSISICIENAGPGLGQPVFHKLKAEFASAFLSIGAAHSVELGLATKNQEQTGIEFHKNSDNYGGVRGGISTGERIFLTVHFKPTSSILDVAKKGRHDPCIVVRAVPVVEAMAHLVLADHLLWKRADQV